MSNGTVPRTWKPMPSLRIGWLPFLLALLLLIPRPANAIQFGAGTGTSYPSALDTTRTYTNKGGGACSPTDTTKVCSELVNDLQSAISAVETALGASSPFLLPLSKGGTNANLTAAAGGLVYSTASALAIQAPGTSGYFAISGGTGAPTWFNLFGTANYWIAAQTIASGTGTTVGLFSVASDTTATGLSYFSQASADADSFDAIFRKSRGTVGTPTVITTADELGTIQFSGYGGASGYVVGAAIKAISSGTIADTRIPAQLEFWTGTNATPSVLTKRMTIDNVGLATIIGTATIKSNDNNLTLDTPGATQYSSIYFNDNGVNKWGFFKDLAHNLTWQPTGNFAITIKNSSGAPMVVLSPLSGGGLGIGGNNGQSFTTAHKTELTTVASGVLTQATTLTIPANAILRSAALRVTVQPGGTATMVATATTSATVLQQGASMSTAANTTDVGTRAWGTNYVGVAAQTITFTFNGVTTDAAGRIRVEIVYDEPVAPTS